MPTRKEMDDLSIKLEEKRPMRWNFVSERMSQQYVAKHYELHQTLIQEILDVRYSSSACLRFLTAMFLNALTAIRGFLHAAFPPG